MSDADEKLLWRSSKTPEPNELSIDRMDRFNWWAARNTLVNNLVSIWAKRKVPHPQMSLNCLWEVVDALCQQNQNLKESLQSLKECEESGRGKQQTEGQQKSTQLEQCGFKVFRIGVNAEGNVIAQIERFNLSQDEMAKNGVEAFARTRPEVKHSGDEIVEMLRCLVYRTGKSPEQAWSWHGSEYSTRFFFGD